jgi:membrane-bound lytic murein transglycosylase D
MQVAKLYWLIAPVGALAVAATSCQSAQKHPSLLSPPKAAPPALVAAPKAAAKGAPQSAEKASRPQPQPIELQPEPKTDPVGQLIEKVEKEYDVAQASYQAGNLEAAKQSFENAFNLLLSAPVEIRSDARLEEEFQKLLDAENGLEITALQEGEGPEQKSEPAPIDEANEAATAVDPKIKAQAEAEIKQTRSDLPLMLNDTVAGYINYFSNRGRGVLERGLTRSGQYDEMTWRRPSRGSTRWRCRGPGRAACGNSCRAAPAGTDCTRASGSMSARIRRRLPGRRRGT